MKINESKPLVSKENFNVKVIADLFVKYLSGPHFLLLWLYLHYSTPVKCLLVKGCAIILGQELQSDTSKCFSFKCPLHEMVTIPRILQLFLHLALFDNFNNLLTGDYNDYLSSSNHVDSATLPPAASFWDIDHADLPELFSKLGLGKYSDLFRQQEVSFMDFIDISLSRISKV